MSGTRTTRYRVVVAASIPMFVAAVLASTVVAGQFRGEDPQSFHAGLATGDVTRVGEIAPDNGLPGRGVFVQKTDTGQFCLWDAPSAASLQRQGGCNPADDPLAGRELSMSFAYDGGPGVENVRDARLIGVTTESVAQVQVLMSDGTRRDVTLRNAEIGGESYRAFGHRVKRGDLRKGVEPVAVIALDEYGAEIDRQETGFAR